MTEIADHNARQMRRWKKRSERVAVVRKVLPAAIVAIVLVMLGFIVVRTLMPGNLLAAKPGTPMVNPRFKGRDKEDMPFLIGAVQAVRDEVDANRIVLNSPFVTLGASRLSAKTGVYRPDLGTLTLQGEVIFDDGKNRLTTGQAIFDAKQGVVSGQPVGPGEGVNVRGDLGEVRADSFRVVQHGGRIELTGNVKGLVNPHR